MSEPWIKVYAADMRGDQKVSELVTRNPAYGYLIIHAWDLAKNGPVPGELRTPNKRPMSAATLAQVVPGISGKMASNFMRFVVDDGLAERTEDGAISFPKLLQRQRVDPTAAERQRRHRAKTDPNGKPPSHAPVTAKSRRDTTVTDTPFEGEEGGVTNRDSHGDVTAQIPEARRKTSGLTTFAPAPSAEVESIDKQRRALFQALCDGSGIDVREVSESERGKLNRAVTQLLDLSATPAMVADRCAAWAEVFPGATITPTGVVSNWARIGARPVEETARRRRDPEFEARLAAAKARG